VTWSLLAVKVGTLNTHGVCTISLQAAVHPLTGPHTNEQKNILEGAISGKKAVRRPRLQYLKHVARNTEADSYTTMKRMV
jgi:hypothetical protein